MAQFEQNGVIYEEMPDGNVRVIGYSQGQGGGMPADPTYQYEGPKAATDLQGGQLDNEYKKTQILEAREGKLPVGWRRKPDGSAEPIPGIPVNDPNKPKATPPSAQAVRAAKQTLSVLQKQNKLFMDEFSGSGLGALGEYNPFSGASQQFNDYSAQILPYTKQLMRSPGEGAQSDKDAADYRALLPSNLVYDETNINRMTNIRDAALDVLKAAGEDVSQYDSLIPGQRPPGSRRDDGAAINPNATVESGPPGSQGDGPVTPLWSDPGPSGGSGGGLESLITGTPQAQIDARNRDNVFGEIDSIGRNFANSATLGLADRVAAAGNAVLPVDNLFGAKNKSIWDGSSFGQAYDANMRLQERTNAADRLANPWTSAGGDIGGSIAGMMLANQMLAKLGASALVAKTGGVAGDVTYGTARGAVEDGPMGALTGGALAAAGGAAGRYVLGPAIGAVAASKPGQAVINTVGRGANAAANVGRGLIGRKSVPFRPTMLPAPVTGGERAALARVPDDVASQLSYAQNAGLPLALADTSPQLQALAGSVVRKSPDAYAMARDTLGARALGQADRAQEQIVRNFGPVANPNDISESLLQQARARSAPLYDAFRAQPARTSDELQVLMQTPAGRQALENARSIAANEGRDPNALGFDLDAQGNVILRSDPSPETLDLVKRGLDDVVGSYRNPVTGQLDLNDQGRAVEGLRQRFVSEVDRLYPNYAEARAAYAGPASERAALQQGRDLATANPRDIQVTMGRMTPGQQEQFKLGQRVAMSDAVDKVRYSSNPYQNIYGSPVAQERAATVFGRGPADEMRRAYETEQRMAQTAYDTLGGSPTAMRLAADEAFDSPLATAIDTGFTIATGGGAPSIGAKAANWIKDSYRLGASKKKADQLAPLLFETNPEKLATALKALKEKSVARDVYIKRARKVGGIFGASTGVSLAPSLR